MKKTPKNTNAEDTRKLNAYLKKKGELLTFRQSIGRSFARRGRPTKAVVEQRKLDELDETLNDE